MHILRNELEYVNKRCSENRFEKIEVEIEKVRVLENLLQTTMERMDEFASKNDIDRIMQNISGLGTSNDFNLF